MLRPKNLPSEHFKNKLSGIGGNRRLRFLRNAAIALLCFSSFSVSASPVIEGNTISWPDDGWYEVQSVVDYASVCQGVRRCDVSPGLYTVINHTTGQRWENLSVGGVGPVVVDIWIKLPMDGFYIVQNAENNNTICEGLIACDVSPGTYTVTNQATGQRWENVVVTTDRTATVPVVSGNRISWSDEGWYQVLTAGTFMSVCEGGSYCEVPDGEYIVINHWTGQRWESVSVNNAVNDMDNDGVLDLNDNCPNTANPDQADEDGNGIGDVCESSKVSDIKVNVESGSVQTVSVAIDVPDPETGGLGGDFMVLFDRSGSFNDDLETFREDVVNIEMALRESFADVRIGLASFSDAPCDFFGEESDFGYELNLGLGEAGTLAEALADLDIRAGADAPESQLEAMRQAITGAGHVVDASSFPNCSPVANIAPTSPGYNNERVRFLLVSTDASFHRPTDAGYPYPTSVQDVISLALETGTTILFLNSGGTDSAAEEIASATGGAVYNLGGASEEIVETLRSAVSETLTSVDVSMVAIGDGAEFVTGIDPDSITVNLLDTRVVTFDVTLSPDIGTSIEDRVFLFELITSAAGAEISRLLVELTVPGESSVAAGSAFPAR